MSAGNANSSTRVDWCSVMTLYMWCRYDVNSNCNNVGRNIVTLCYWYSSYLSVLLLSVFCFVALSNILPHSFTHC